MSVFVKVIAALSLLAFWVNAFAEANPKSRGAFETPRSSVVDLVDPISKRVYPLFIKLPKSYNKDKRKKYPVIYLTDALYSFQIASGTTRLLMNTGDMKDAILVGISYAIEDKGSASRNRDLTPVRDPKWKSETGGAEQHMAFIKDSVFNYIESNFRASAINRTYVGISFGGLFGSFILMNDAQMFKNYVLVSPSYWWSNRYMFTLERQFSQQANNLDANIFLAVGEKETVADGAKYNMVADAEHFYKKILTWPSENVEIHYQIVANSYHNSVFPAALTQGLLWVLGRCDLEQLCPKH